MKRLSGDEHFSFAGKQEERKIVDVWSWHSSELLADTTRAILAEYIVAMALGIDQNTTQNGWDDYDLDYNGTHIEIKSSSYLQAWKFVEQSKIVFRISPTKSTFWKDNEVKRRADIYVFCLFACKDREIADLMKLEQWEFYVVKTSDIDKTLGDQKTLSLWRLTQLPHIKCTYEDIKTSIDTLL